jgi:hypothetical protein
MPYSTRRAMGLVCRIDGSYFKTRVMMFVLLWICFSCCSRKLTTRFVCVFERDVVVVVPSCRFRKSAWPAFALMTKDLGMFDMGRGSLAVRLRPTDRRGRGRLFAPVHGQRGSRRRTRPCPRLTWYVHPNAAIMFFTSGNFGVSRPLFAVCVVYVIFHRPTEAPAGSRTVCRYYLEGGCYRADCWFAHDVGAMPCKFWHVDWPMVCTTLVSIAMIAMFLIPVFYCRCPDYIKRIPRFSMICCANSPRP